MARVEAAVLYTARVCRAEDNDWKCALWKAHEVRPGGDNL